MSTLATSAACDRIFFIAGLAAMKNTSSQKLFDFASVAFSFGRADALSNDRVEFGLLKRLGQIVDGAQAHGLHDFARVIHAREHDNLQSGLQVAELFESLQAIDAGHEQIEQHQIRLQPFANVLDGFFAGAGGLNFVLIHFQQGAV